ncbi:SemiSWEET transporter [bacterium]|nr:SemiSWEET transporter [bacterium]
MDFTEIIGFVAAVCTTISFVPQVVRIWRTKSTKDISLGMFLIFCAGVILWLTYGLLLNNLPIIVANTVTLFLILTILSFKIRYK